MVDAHLPNDPDSLNHIIDDLSTREQCADWIAEGLIEGRTVESLTEELVANGWHEDDASDLIEQVRRLTRNQRGVVTRNDIVRDADRRYRRAMGGWFTGLPTFTAAFKLLNSLITLVGFRRIKNEKRDPTED